MSRASRWEPPQLDREYLATIDLARRRAKIQIALGARLHHDLRGYADRDQAQAIAFFTLTDGGRLICEGYSGPGAQIPSHLRPLLARRYDENLDRLPDGTAERAP